MAALPLPFGSVIERARVPLIAVPIAICIVATLLRFYVVRRRLSSSRPTTAWLIWAGGTALFLVAGLLQLIPLPSSLLGALSPESHTLWSAASRVAALAGAPVSALHPISVDPEATRFELYRIVALLATFTGSTLLIRKPGRRVALAVVLCVAAVFEALYGAREAALHRYEIWGWKNKLIFDRVTGTFVNPNHFAHYLALVVPMAIFIAAFAWYRTGDSRVPLRRRLAVLMERQVLWLGLAAISAIMCIAGILLAQSRGALLSLGGGILIVAACLPGKRVTRIVLGAVAGVLLVGAVAWFLGAERTSLARFSPTSGEQATLGGRLTGIEAAIGVWKRFPFLGSGLGTFDRVEFMEQRRDIGKTYQHAHNDYVEIAATTGTAGYLIAILTLFGGYIALLRMTFGAAGMKLGWPRRAYQAAALMSLTIAMIHALFDFNFFIPSNPATLAAIVGAAVAAV
ncbi:MAG TPA: O-antigen ligase family protein, partial [Thermoanaerobaculia bacterium]|nr:O-antigen ligase family protein [Thermoanaerobaculia bacterium]